MGRAQRGAQRRHRAGGGARAIKLAVLAALVVPLTTGCSVDEVLRFGWPSGITPQAEAMRQLWTWSAITALVVGAVTWGAMFWTVAFHRKRKGDDTLPRQTQYNLPVEIAFTVIPTIIVAVLFGFTVSVQNYVDSDSAEPPDLAVDIRGFQWNWEFTYPDAQGPEGEPVSTLGDSNTIPLLVLPTERTIEFTQASSDVIHSFFVPEFLFKRDVFPLPELNNQDNVWQIERIDQAGSFVGRCAELCGTYHAKMNFEVRALPPETFDQWLLLRGQVNPATGAPYTAGEALAELECEGNLCAPAAITTFPFNTDRTDRAPSGAVAAGN
ncbi:MAG: cytochrome c oxidase subunit II [Tomitella sp.]|nr:cytochrome c oxidase subunit II [Tomitella sp.]